MENVLAYADGILVLCTGMPTMKKVIEVTENGSTENGMIMNKRKSAIVEFLPRMCKKEFITSKSVMGVPVKKNANILAYG